MVRRSRALFASLVASIRSRSARQGPSFGSGWTSREYSKQVAPERSTLRTVLRDTFSSRTISLIDFPLTKCSRRIRPIVSTTSIPPPPTRVPQAGSLCDSSQTGSKLDADHPSTGVNLPRRNTGGLVPEQVAAFITAQQDFTPNIVVLDTLATAIAGEDENSSKAVNDPDWTVGIKLGRDRNGSYW